MTDPTGGAPNPEAPIPAEPAGAMPTEPAAATAAEPAGVMPASRGRPPPAAPAAAAPPPTAPAPPPAGPELQAPPPVMVAAAAGPAPGIAYADLITRVIAFIIDAILLGILSAFISLALGALLLGFLLSGGIFGVIIATVLLSAATLFLSALYFIWGWTNPAMRASLGQKALGPADGERCGRCDPDPRAGPPALGLAVRRLRPGQRGPAGAQWRPTCRSWARSSAWRPSPTSSS